VEKYGRARQATNDNMAHALCTRWIPNATNTHSEYVTFIAFPLKQWLYERAVMLRYRHIARLVVAPPSETLS
jgi:hypothetical protein